MPKMKRFDFTKKNKRTGQVDKVGYLDLKEDEEKRNVRSTFTATLYQRHGNLSGTRRTSVRRI